MSVNAISNYNYTYSTTYDTSEQYKYFKAIISNDQIKELLLKYGITSSGDSATDLNALYQVMATDVKSQLQATSANASSQTQQQNNSQTASNTTIVPWANLMSQVGLSPTGDLSTDYESFNNRIQVMLSGAQSQQDKANVYQLEAEASIVFVQQEASSQTQSPAQAQAQTVSAADITAQINKIYVTASYG
jgi:hypothetical protein